MECDLVKQLNYSSLTKEEVKKTLLSNNIKGGYIYKKIYYEFIDPYPYVLQHPVPIIRLWYYFLYFLLLIGNFFKMFILNPIKTIKKFFIRKTKTTGVERNTDVCSLNPETNNIVDFLRDKEKKEVIIKTESFYFSHKESEQILKELLEAGFKIPFVKSLSEFFRIKIRIEYILNPTKQKKNEVKILYTFPKTVMDVLNFEKSIKEKIKNWYNFFREKQKKEIE